MSDDEVTNLLVRALSPIERDRHDGACRTLQLLHGRPARFVGPFSLAGILVDARDGGSVAAVYTDAVCRRAAVPRSMAARSRQGPAGNYLRTHRAAALDHVGSEPDHFDRRRSRQPRSADHRLSVPSATATTRLVFRSIVTPWSAPSSPRPSRRYWRFRYTRGLPIDLDQSCCDELGAEFVRKTSRAPRHGRHVDSPLSGPEDDRSSLSSRTQHRAGHDGRSLGAVCSASPYAPLAGLAAGRDDRPKCGRVYTLVIRVRGSSRPPREPHLPYGSHHGPQLAWPRDDLGLYDRRRRTAGGDERLPRDSRRVRRRFRTLGQGHSDGAREYGVFSVRCPGFQKAGSEVRPRGR